MHLPVLLGPLLCPGYFSLAMSYVETRTPSHVLVHSTVSRTGIDDLNNDGLSVRVSVEPVYVGVPRRTS